MMSSLKSLDLRWKPSELESIAQTSRESRQANSLKLKNTDSIEPGYRLSVKKYETQIQTGSDTPKFEPTRLFGEDALKKETAMNNTFLRPKFSKEHIEAFDFEK